MKKFLALLIFAFGWSCINAMDNNIVYIRSSEGDIVQIDKTLLSSIKTLAEMMVDIPDSGNNPETAIPLHTITSDELNQIINLIKSVHDFIAQNPQIKKTVHSLQPFIWDIFKDKANRYNLIAQLLKIGDFLDIDPFILGALKKIVFNATTLDSESQALENGFNDLDNLPNEIQFFIKTDIINSINNNLINMSIFEIANKHKLKHIKIIQKIPEELKNTFNYSKRRNKDLDFLFLSGNTALVTTLTKESKSNFFINPQALQLDIPNVMSQVPNQIFLSQDIIDIGLDLTRVPCPHHTMNPIFPFICTSSDDLYTCFSFSYYLNLGNQGYKLISVGVINDNKTGKRVLVPAMVKFVSSFTNKQGEKKVVCIIGNEKPKVVLLDSQLNTIHIINNNLINNLHNFYVTDSLLVHSGINNENKPSLEIIDLNDGNTLMDIPLDDLLPYAQLTACMNKDKTQLTITGLLNYDPNSNLYAELITYTIDIKNKTIIHIEGDVLSTKQAKLFLIDSIPSKTFALNLNHPDIKSLVDVDFIETNNAVFVTGCNFQNKTFPVFTYIDKNEIMQLLNSSTKLNLLSLKELTILSNLLKKLSDDVFNEMTPIEQTLFQKLPEPIQEALITIFSIKKQNHTKQTTPAKISSNESGSDTSKDASNDEPKDTSKNN